MLRYQPLKEICQIVLYNSFVPYFPKVSEFLLTVRQKGQVFQDSSDDKDSFWVLVFANSCSLSVGGHKGDLAVIFARLRIL
jgi:hypothetical protein